MTTASKNPINERSGAEGSFRAGAPEYAIHIACQVERFKPCGGIRIEDDVVCTTGEPENLTRAAFLER